MDYQTLINENIKKLRKNNNLTQEQFAEKIGISLQGLSNIERNKYQPAVSTIDKICKKFKITPAELLVEMPKENETIIKNIIALLATCQKSKLKKIYETLKIMVKM